MLTDPVHPFQDEDHLVLHPGEGDTRHVPGPPLRIDFRAQLAEVANVTPIWQLLLLAALVALAAERAQAAWGGRTWQ